MKDYVVTVKFNSPYMQHRMDDVKLEEWEKTRSDINSTDSAKGDEVRAEYHSYYDPATKSYFIPSTQIKGALIEAGKMVKGKMGSSTKSMKSIVAGMMIVGPEQITIPKYNAIDKRSAVNKAIKGRVMVIRPKWETGLQVSFKLRLKDGAEIPIETIKKVITYAGQSVGVGSFRPMNNGEFGCYDLVSLEEVKEKTV